MGFWEKLGFGGNKYEQKSAELEQEEAVPGDSGQEYDAEAVSVETMAADELVPGEEEGEATQEALDEVEERQVAEAAEAARYEAADVVAGDEEGLIDSEVTVDAPMEDEKEAA